jgi:undecaprenyl-phosphate 4-deoxy-4-formamido-L-arabinose transferase
MHGAGFNTGGRQSASPMREQTAMPLSVVVPVYNSAQSLPILVERLRAVLSAQTEEYELIFVNDGSVDESWPVIVRLSEENCWIRAFNLMRNYGQHNALLCGIRAARHPVIVTMDDDLQNPPEEIPKLLAMLDDATDVVYAKPATENHGILRDLASQFTKLALSGAMGLETARDVSAFRAFRTQLREAFAAYRSPHVSIDVLLTWGTRRFTSITVQNNPRTLGTSNYTLAKLIRHALNMITGFSVIPLQIASVAGFAFTAFGFVVLAYVLTRYMISGDSVPGFPFLASVVAIFSGAQLFALGIIGEYLARVHLRIMDQPSYTIRSCTNLIGDGCTSAGLKSEKRTERQDSEVLGH